MSKIETFLKDFFQSFFLFWEQNPLWVCIAFFLVFLVYFLRQSFKKKEIYGLERIAGMQEVKNQIYNDVIFPFYHAKQYEKFHISLPNGILFYGPTGCGKTFFVERLAEELAMNYIKISHADLASPYIHETVSKISNVFEKAKASAPCIVFFDELEGLLPSRESITDNALYKNEEVNEFLLHLDNAASSGILVIGATNHINKIDPAVLRSGRFDLKIHIPPPDFEARKELFEAELKEIPHSNEIDFSELAKLTENYTNSDIVNIVKSAARETIASGEKEITQTLIKQSIQKTPSSLEND